MKNNAVTLDNSAQFDNRIHTFVNGISSHGIEIGYSEEEIVGMLDYVARYDELEGKQKVERADLKAVYAVIKEREGKTREHVYRCRHLVRGESVMVDDESKKYLAERFLLDKKVLKRRAELIAMAENMVEAYDGLSAEKPDILLPSVPFESLRTAIESLKTALIPASRERAEKKAIIVARRALRAEGNRILRSVYLRAVSFWGIDDSRLLKLGMLPKSMVWTSKKKKVEEE